jgi:hypothetical protein
MLLKKQTVTTTEPLGQSARALLRRRQQRTRSAPTPRRRRATPRCGRSPRSRGASTTRASASKPTTGCTPCPCCAPRSRRTSGRTLCRNVTTRRWAVTSAVTRPPLSSAGSPTGQVRHARMMPTYGRVMSADAPRQNMWDHTAVCFTSLLSRRAVGVN